MRIAARLVKDHYAFTITILLIVAALAAGVMACDGADTYQLTISSASGGSVVTPGEGTFTYGSGSVVQVVAMPDDGYQFRSWTGDIQHIANPDAASTTIALNGNYAIVANFDTEGEAGADDGGPFRP